MKKRVPANKIAIIMLFSFSLLILSVSSWAADYYVDNQKGNDENPGTLARPWKTIGKANETLRAGDTVIIRAGTYNESIFPANSGTTSNRITYTSYMNEQVIISGVSTGIDLNHNSFISVDGINIRDVATYANLEYGHHNWIKNGIFNNLHNKDGWSTGILIQHNSHHNWLDNIEAGNCGYVRNGRDVGGVVQLGDNTETDTSNFNLIENCTLYNGGHHVLIVQSGYNIIRNNQFYNENWMNGTYGNRNISGIAEPGYGDFLVIEGNRFSYSALPIDAPFSNSIKFALNKSIIRNNLIYNANGTGIGISSWTYSATSNNHRVYNNVVYYNGYRSQEVDWQHGIGFTSWEEAQLVQGSVIVNNIFHANKGGSLSFVIEGRDSAANHDIRTNWWDTDGNPLFVNDTIPSSPSDKTLPDLTIRADSPCINAGEFLTTVTSPSGSGTSFQVEDATFFIDGWDIVEGDSIQLQDKTEVLKIVKIDYDSNQIIVDQATNWNRGDGVSLPYNGNAPDLGAFESDAVNRLSENDGSGGGGGCFVDIFSHGR